MKACSRNDGHVMKVMLQGKVKYAAPGSVLEIDVD